MSTHQPGHVQTGNFWANNMKLKSSCMTQQCRVEAAVGPQDAVSLHSAHVTPGEAA